MAFRRKNNKRSFKRKRYNNGATEGESNAISTIKLGDVKFHGSNYNGKAKHLALEKAQKKALLAVPWKPFTWTITGTISSAVEKRSSIISTNACCLAYTYWGDDGLYWEDVHKLVKQIGIDSLMTSNVAPANAATYNQVNGSVFRMYDCMISKCSMRVNFHNNNGFGIYLDIHRVVSRCDRQIGVYGSDSMNLDLPDLMVETMNQVSSTQLGFHWSSKPDLVNNWKFLNTRRIYVAGGASYEWTAILGRDRMFNSRELALTVPTDQYAKAGLTEGYLFQGIAQINGATGLPFAIPTGSFNWYCTKSYSAKASPCGASYGGEVMS